jgi:hypothetical protein
MIVVMVDADLLCQARVARRARSELVGTAFFGYRAFSAMGAWK